MHDLIGKRELLVSGFIPKVSVQISNALYRCYYLMTNLIFVFISWGFKTFIEKYHREHDPDKPQARASFPEDRHSSPFHRSFHSGSKIQSARSPFCP